MGIFDNPKRLAKLLGSVNVPGEDRPLSPVTTARWLKEGVDELGDSQKVMERINLKKSMWQGFQRLLTINEDIENGIKWGRSNPNSMQIGFSAAHAIASFEPSEQIILVNAMWDYGEPFGFESLRRIKSYYKSHSDESLESAISTILKVDKPRKKIISIFISGLKSDIFDLLKQKSIEQKISLDDFAKNILAKNFSENSISNVKVRENLIRIIFSESGKREFNQLAKSKNISKNDIVNILFKLEGL